MRGTAGVTTTATRSGDGWTLSGTKNPVLAGDVADTLIVSAALPGQSAEAGTGLFLVDAADVTRQGYRTFDGQPRRPDRPSTPRPPSRSARPPMPAARSPTPWCGSRPACAPRPSA